MIRFVNIKSLLIMILYSYGNYQITFCYRFNGRVNRAENIFLGSDTMKISVVRTTDEQIGMNDIVTVHYSDKHMAVTKCNNISDIPYKKLSENQYLNVSNGQIKTINKSENEIRSVNSVRKTFSMLMNLISHNFYGGSSELFITLTYNRKITETNSVNSDIKNFWSRFCRFVGDSKAYKAVFILEYQLNHNIHLHVLIQRQDGSALYFSELDIKSLWKNGSVDVTPIYDIDGLIEYLNPFRNQKKFDRLSYYKVNQKIFRCRGQFTRPKKLKVTYADALKIAEAYNLKEYKSDSYKVIDSNNTVVNQITKINFKETKYVYLQ